MWVCPKCERELKKENQWHNCVKVSIDSLFEGKSEDLIILFDKILSEVVDWEHVLVSTTQNCIVFVHRQTFLIIKPMKKELDLKFYSDKELTERYIFKSTAHSSRYENHIRISTPDDLGPHLYRHLRRSYELL
jgi:hypothetical protein